MPQIKVNLAQTPQGPPSPGKPLTRAQANQILHQQSKLSFKEVLANLKKTGATPEDLRRIEEKLLGREGLLMSMTARNRFGLGDNALNLAILQVLLQGTRNQASGIQSFKAFEAYVDRLLKGQSEADDFYKRVRQHAGVLRAGAEGGPQSPTSPTSPISPIGYINPNITQSRGWGPFAAGIVDGVLEVGLASGLSTLGFTSNPLQGLRDLKDSFNQGAAALKFVFSHLPKATQAGAQALVKAVQGIPGMSDYHKGKLLVQAVLLVIGAVGAAKAGAKLASVAKEIASGKVRTLGQIKAWMQASGNSGLNSSQAIKKISKKINLENMTSEQLLEEIKKLKTPSKAAQWFEKNQKMLEKNSNFKRKNVQEALRESFQGSGIPKNIPVIVAEMTSPMRSIIGEAGTIGRSYENRFPIPSQANRVSRNHAEILDLPDGPSIKDLNSSYGTWLNGKKIPPNTKVTLPEFSKVLLGDPKVPNSFYEFIYISKEVQENLKTNPFMNSNKYSNLESLNEQGIKISRDLATARLPQDQEALNNALKNVFEAQLFRFRDKFNPDLIESKIYAYNKHLYNIRISKNVRQYEEFGRYPGNNGKPFDLLYIEKSIAAQNYFKDKLVKLNKISVNDFIKITKEQHEILNYKSDYPGLIRYQTEALRSPRPLAADYTNAIFERYKHLDLGEVPNGKIQIDGISNDNLPQSFSVGEGYGIHFYPKGSSLKAYFNQGVQLLNQIQAGIRQGKPAEEVQRLIGKYYHVMANARPFYATNNSLFMIQVNVLLKKTGHPGFKNHGDLDHLFMRINSDQAEKLWREALKGNFPNSRDFGINNLK